MRKVPLEATWQFAEAGSEDWRPAVVPGSIHLDLAREGLIPDPLQGANEATCRWVDGRPWDYRCVLDPPPDIAVPASVLAFEGLDTVCELFLDGERLATHENMFLPLELDIATRMRQGAKELLVRFHPAAEIGEARRRAYLAAQGLDPDTSGFFERSFVRKAQYMFGWDWGPRLVSCGIFRPVFWLTPSPRMNVPRRGGQVVGSSAGRVQLVRSPDRFGASFQFTFDGTPVWIKGANWIPDHSFPSEVTADRLRQRLTQAKDLGINMLRVWGGGLYEQDTFYDLCDELDILVWQDFMFACAYYPEEEAFLEEVRREAEYQVTRLRCHRCLALWCGNNENQMMFAQKWGEKEKQPRRLYGEHIYNVVLRDVVQRLDPGRPYIEGSPIGGDDPNSGRIGDQHFWDVWHGRGDWVHYTDSTARFCSEFGFASSPSIEAWSRCLSKEEMTIGSPSMLAHDKTGKPWDEFRRLVELHYPSSESLGDWSYYSQLNQRDAMRCAIEHFRRSSFCSGTLAWQLNDCWTAQSWSLIDSTGRYKAAAYEMRRLYAPRLLSIVLNETAADVWAISDDAPWNGEVRLSAISLSSSQATQIGAGKLSLSAGGRSVALRADLSGISRTDNILVATCCEVLAHSLCCEPKEARFELNPISLRKGTGELLMSCDLPLVDLMLRDSQGDAQFEDNFLQLLTGEARVRTDCPPERVVARSLAGIHPIRLL